MWHVRAALVIAVLAGSCPASQATATCSLDDNPLAATEVGIQDGQTLYRHIGADETHRYEYINTNVSALAQSQENRKVILHLEPCHGVVYLFVKKSRPCYPDPYTCISSRATSDCSSTHYVSDLTGTHDGAPTFFEIPLSTTKYYISVYARESSSYTLTVIADVGAYPRPGNNGVITARQTAANELQVSWGAATFTPAGVSQLEQYWLYVTLLLDGDNQTSDAVVLSPDKVMNTVCGLSNNTDRSFDRYRSEICAFGLCNTTITGVIGSRQYLINVVAESARGYRMAYAGLIATTEWDTTTQLTSDQALKAIAAVAGSVLGILLIVFFVMWRVYL